MSPVRKSETPGSGFRRCYRRRGSLSLAGRGLGLCASKLSADGFGYPPNAGIEGLAAGDPLSLAAQRPFGSSSFAMPTLPRQGPSNESSQECHDESQKFESSTCGVEMLACGEYTSCLTCMASPCRAGDIRSRPKAGGAGRANTASLYRMAPVWPHGDKQVTVLGTLIVPARVSGQNSIRCRRHHV